MSKIKISNIFYFFAILILVGSFSNYFLFTKTTKYVETTTKNIYTKYTKEVSANIVDMIVNSTESDIYNNLKTDKLLRKKLNEHLSFFITHRYRYIYVVTRKNGEFRFLLDGAKNIEDKSEFDEIYEPLEKNIWNQAYNQQKEFIFKQTDADVTSFDGGYGSAYLAKMVGQKRAREIFFLGRNYSAQEAYEMGMVNAVIPHKELESTAYAWAQEILAKSPTSIKMLKFAMNLTDDGMVGQQVFAGEATRLAYMTDEAKEGRDAFLEKRKPNFPKKWIP